MARVSIAHESSSRSAGRLYRPIAVSNLHAHASRCCPPRSSRRKRAATVTALAIPARPSSVSSPLRVLVSTGDVMGDIHAATLVQALLAQDDSMQASLPPKGSTAESE